MYIVCVAPQISMGEFTALHQCGQMCVCVCVCVNKWAGVKSPDPPCLVTIWKDHKKRQWDTGHAVSAWRSCQPSEPPGFPKTSISHLGSGDSRLLRALSTQLCTIGRLGFLLGCSPAESPLPDHLRTPQALLCCYRSGVKTFTCRKSFFPPLLL